MKKTTIKPPNISGIQPKNEEQSEKTKEKSSDSNNH